MKAIIVEDEPKAIENLVAALGRAKPGVKVVGKCKSASEAIRTIEILKPELIFLDVQLEGDMTGFDVLEQTIGYDYKVIFTSSYKKHAFAAFEYNAVHYLLKPYSDEKLIEAVDRAELISMQEQRQRIEALKTTEKFVNSQDDYFPFRKNNGDYMIRNYNDCMFLKADGPDIYIYFNDGSKEHSTNKSLTEYENILKFRGFIRTSQNHLVNLRFIRKFKKPPKMAAALDSLEGEKKEGAGGSVVLLNDEQIPISRQYRQQIKDVLNIH